jgi:phosphatidylserine/phosphatidylglycerophosphate/cardiolipin synthase-like enzyme
VTVRVVMESENMDGPDEEALIKAGIPIVGDEQEGLMHDKFIVIDRSEVWTGSMNYTDSGTYEDNNNMMRIHSTKLAENYSVEFNEMFEDNKFGPDVVAETPNPSITIDGTQVDTYFSPDDHVLTAIYNLLNGANESIYFLAYSFTSNELGDIVRKKADAGLDVKGVMDEGQVASNTGTEYDPFLQAGLDVRIDGIDGLMHHKVFIVDEKIVVLGSYNFSSSAEEKNDENIIIVYDEKIAEFFVQEFERVYAQAHK